MENQATLFNVENRDYETDVLPRAMESKQSNGSRYSEKSDCDIPTGTQRVAVRQLPESLAARIGKFTKA